MEDRVAGNMKLRRLDLLHDGSINRSSIQKKYQSTVEAEKYTLREVPVDHRRLASIASNLIVMVLLKKFDR